MKWYGHIFDPLYFFYINYTIHYIQMNCNKVLLSWYICIIIVVTRNISMNQDFLLTFEWIKIHLNVNKSNIIVLNIKNTTIFCGKFERIFYISTIKVELFFLICSSYFITFFDSLKVVGYESILIAFNIIERHITRWSHFI